MKSVQREAPSQGPQIPTVPWLRSDQCRAFFPYKGKESGAEIAKVKEQMRKVSINSVMEMSEDREV